MDKKVKVKLNKSKALRVNNSNTIWQILERPVTSETVCKRKKQLLSSARVCKVLRWIKMLYVFTDLFFPDSFLKESFECFKTWERL